MSRDGPSMEERTGLLVTAARELQLWWRLLWDSRVPFRVKLVPISVVIYILSPIDIASELFVPGLGYLDDLALLILAMNLFVALSPAQVVADIRAELKRQHEQAATPAAVDAEYRVVCDDQGDRAQGQRDLQRRT
ncbi:MAG: DUF1232 domain-containing protein [Anaerolineae bacterium]